MTIVLYEKLVDGELLKLGDRAWDEKLIQALNVANFILVGGKEYEMIEGRLNLDLHVFELLLVAASSGEGGREQ